MLQQCQQGRACIEVTLAVSQVGMGKQHLRAAHTMGAQLGFVHLRQAHLPHSGCRLQCGHLAGSRGPAQALHAFCNGAAGHHDDFLTRLRQLRQLAAPLANGGFVQASTLIGHQAGTHLDHDATRITQDRGKLCGHRCLGRRFCVYSGVTSLKRGSISTAPCSSICWVRMCL